MILACEYQYVEVYVCISKTNECKQYSRLTVEYGRNY